MRYTVSRFTTREKGKGGAALRALCHARGNTLYFFTGSRSMKKILLVDDSVTVQKVVSLSLDKSRYALSYAKSRLEAIKLIHEVSFDLVLVSDKISELTAGTFPSEVEVALRGRPVPPMVWVTTQELNQMHGFAGVLKKPFTPQDLKAIVVGLTEGEDIQERRLGGPGDLEEERLAKMFNETFSDESRLVSETLKDEGTPPSEDSRMHPKGWEEKNARLWADATPAKTENGDSLWGTQSAAKPDLQAMESKLESELGPRLDEALDRWLLKRVPPIVERLVHERLDKLLLEAEQQFEIKP